MIVDPQRMWLPITYRIRASYPERVAVAKELKALQTNAFDTLIAGLRFEESYYSSQYLSYVIELLQYECPDSPALEWLWAEIRPQVEAWEKYGLKWIDHCRPELRRGFVEDQKRRLFEATERLNCEVGSYVEATDAGPLDEDWFRDLL